MVSRSLVLAYHGTDATLAREVAAGRKELEASAKEYDWLGTGLYFWEDSPKRASQWAEERKGRDIKHPGVLGAVIDLGNCLNLIDAEHLGLVKAAHQEYREICQTSGSPPLENKGTDLKARYLDRAVMETLHGLHNRQGKPPFDTVRAFFVEGAPLYETAGLRSLDHIQICVRNPKKIIGYFLPREAIA